MRLHRFYVLQPLGEEVVIDDVSILKQWTKVFRYQKGAFVILFNGEGTDVTYSIESISAKESVLSRQKLVPTYMPPVHVTLYLSILKKDNFELALQKATELGVSTIVPIISERSEKKGLNEERLVKIAVEAAEQCGRGDVPVVMPPVTLAQVFEVPTLHDVSYLLQMGGTPLKDQKRIKAAHVGLFIGPEGGWSGQEEKLFTDQGIIASSLGSTVLRTETAAIVACALILV